jgi:hypothetical protein
MRERLPACLLAVSVFVLIATPIAVWASRPDLDVGSLPGTTAVLDPVFPSIIPETEAGTLSSSGIAIPDVVVRSARLRDYRPPPHGARPVGVTIDSIGVRATVVPVGVQERSKTVEVPTDVRTVGWYRFGPAPGANGSAVLIGHVDSRVLGPGAFFRLRELAPGDLLTMLFANGSRSSFEVVARRFYPKDKLPGSVFQRSGGPMLTLVTCGGAFDQATGSYADNVVVFAVPAG